MESDNRTIVTSFLRERARALEFVAAAVVLAIGTNLVAAALSDALTSGAALVSGAALTLLGTAYVTARAFGVQRKRRRIRGFVLYAPHSNEITAQDFHYDFARSIRQYVQAGFFENPAMKAAWDREPLTALLPATNSPDETSSATGSLPADPRLFAGDLDVTYTVVHVPQLNTTAARSSLDLLQEAAEYFLLAHLSRHLDAYFKDSAQDARLVRISHQDMPDVLLENRFLRIFAEPMEERATFMHSENLDRANIRAATAPGGALFESFNLILPHKTSIVRAPSGGIEIRTSRFTVKLVARCEGYVTTLSPLYTRDYLGLNALAEPRLIDLEVHARPRRLTMLLPSGWTYYQWLDTWLDALVHAADYECYLLDIGWAAAETVILSGRGSREPPPPVAPRKRRPPKRQN